MAVTKLRQWAEKLSEFGVGEFFYDNFRLFYEDGEEIVRFSGRTGKWAWLLFLNDAVAKTWWFPEETEDDILDKYVLTIAIVTAAMKQFLHDKMGHYCIGELDSGISVFPFYNILDNVEFLFPFITMEVNPKRYKVWIKIVRREDEDKVWKLQLRQLLDLGLLGLKKKTEILFL